MASIVKRVALAVLLLALVGVGACGDDKPVQPAVEVPPWAKVAPEQIAEAKKYGVPVAFENDLGMRFVLIPAGTFLMGSPEDEDGRDDDESQHEVTIPRPYYMQIAEVTNGQFRAWHPDHSSGEYRFHLAPAVDGRDTAISLDGDQQPVAEVSWQDAQEFVGWLQQRETGRAYALPTEEQWEHACRAGTANAFSWGEDEPDSRRRANGLDAVTAAMHETGPSVPDLGYPRYWPCDDGFRGTAPVGSFPPNAWGLMDMHGNVWEWCQDVYRDPTEGDPAHLHLREGLLERVIRGGGWLCPPWMLRSAHRFGTGSTFKEGEIGFRLVSPLPAPKDGK